MELERIETNQGVSRYRVTLENGFKAEIIQFKARQWDYILSDKPKSKLENRAKTRKQILKLVEIEYQEWSNEQDNRRRGAGMVQNRD